jgi:hypothetical protein
MERDRLVRSLSVRPAISTAARRLGEPARSVLKVDCRRHSLLAGNGVAVTGRCVDHSPETLFVHQVLGPINKIVVGSLGSLL